MLKLPCQMKLKSFIIFVLFFLLQFLSSAGFVFAAVVPALDPYCTPGNPASGINTALGCISTKAEPGSGSFFESLIKIAVGLGGGLALVLMLYGVFIVTTSAGMPDKLKEGSDVITSAITGLIFIILSVFLLNFIGINILGLPGLS